VSFDSAFFSRAIQYYWALQKLKEKVGLLPHEIDVMSSTKSSCSYVSSKRGLSEKDALRTGEGPPIVIGLSCPQVVNIWVYKQAKNSVQLSLYHVCIVFYWVVVFCLVLRCLILS
jgi:hypothetical protein